MSGIQLGYLGLQVSNPQAWANYATRFLGAMAAPAAPSGAARYRLDDRAWRIAVSEGPLDDVDFIGLELADLSALSETVKRLSDAGFSVVEGTPDQRAERGVAALYLSTDPTGIGVELYVGPTIVSHQPFASPAGVSFVTGDQGLGHLAIATMDLAKTRAFYLEGLGFRQADWILMQLSPELAINLEFYYGNPRHHTVAIAPLPFPSPKRVHHMMLQVETLDQVGYAQDRAKENGVTLTQSLGRHSNDKMVSFYCATPSGFELEYGFGAIEVHEPDWSVARHDRISAWGHHRL